MVERGPEKAGVGGPIPSLGIIERVTCLSLLSVSYKKRSDLIDPTFFTLYVNLYLFYVSRLVAFGALRNLKFDLIPFR